METLQQHNPNMFNPSWKTKYLNDLYFWPKEHLLVLDFHPQCNRHWFWEGTQVTDGDSQMEYHIQQKHREDRKGNNVTQFQWHQYTYQWFSAHSCNILVLSDTFPVRGWPYLRGPDMTTTHPPAWAPHTLHLYGCLTPGKTILQRSYLVLELHLN